jgi:tetratricopeptide (TPR) repeat protein
MKVRVFLVFFIVFFLFLSISRFDCQNDQEKRRILFDEFHTSRDLERHLAGFLSDLKEVAEQRDEEFIIRFSEERLSSFQLSYYDVLVLFVPSIPYSFEEDEAITKFVEEGGVLITFGEHGRYMEENNVTGVINSISEEFGIHFNSDEVIDPEHNLNGKTCYPVISNIVAHPVTKGVSSIGYICGCSLTLSSATPLALSNRPTSDGKQHSDIVILAITKYGQGRVLAIGDMDFLYGSSDSEENEDYLSLEDNKMLAFNMFDWSASVRTKTANAHMLASEGSSFSSSSMYLEARSKLEAAYNIYVELADASGVFLMETMIDNCNKAIDARIAFERGQTYYKNREYEKALSQFESGRSLYDEIGDKIKSVEIQSMIDLCLGYIHAEDLRQQAIQYCDRKEYEKATDAFKGAQVLYQELGDVASVNELQKEIEKAQTKADIQGRRDRMATLFAIFFVTVVISLIVYAFSRTKEPRHIRALTTSETSYCTFCGKRNTKSALYCQQCGRPLKPVDELIKETASDFFGKKLADREINNAEYHEAMKGLEDI